MSRKTRRPYIPVHRLQWRLTVVVLFFMILAALVGGYTVFFTGWSILGEKLSYVYPQGQLMQIFQTVNFSLARNILVAIPFIFFFSFMITQRIAGPITRIRGTLAQIAGGKYSIRITLRKGDEFQDIAESINVLAEALQKGRSSSTRT